METPLSIGLVAAAVVLGRGGAGEGGDDGAHSPADSDTVNLNMTFESSGSLCLGRIADCPALTEHSSICTRIQYGPCGDGQTEPTRSITSEMVGTLVVNARKLHEYRKCSFLEIADELCGDAATGKAHAFGGPPDESAMGGYHDDWTDGPNKSVVMHMAGSYNVCCDHPGVSYFGFRSALNTGQTPFEKRKLDIYYGTYEQFNFNTTDWSHSYNDTVAPEGPFEICATDTFNGDCTGPVEVIEPGELMYTKFAFFSGPHLAQEEWGEQYNMTHLGARMRYWSEDGLDIRGMLVNGHPVNQTAADESIATLSIPHASGTLDYRISQEVHVGQRDLTTDKFITMGIYEMKIILIEANDKGYVLDYLWPMDQCRWNTQYVMHNSFIKNSPPSKLAPLAGGASKVAASKYLSWAAALVIMSAMTMAS